MFYRSMLEIEYKCSVNYFIFCFERSHGVESERARMTKIHKIFMKKVLKD